MEMAVRSMKTAETVMETDGDGSGYRNRDFCPPKFVFDAGGAAELLWEKRRSI
jgi:hypothetical protein